MKINNRRLMSIVRVIGLSIGLLFLMNSTARAQVLYGSLVGNVTDSSGAAVPLAKVSITHQQTNLTRETQTNDSGVYTFSTIPGGTYNVVIAKEGFQAIERRDVAVTTNSVVRVDVGLTVGLVTQKIEVSASAAALLQTDRAEVRSELADRAFESIPLPPGRNFQQLFVSLPGFSPANRGGSSVTNPSKALAFDVNGGLWTSVGMRIDGASAVGNWMAENATYAPSLEAVETVNAVTGSFDAEQGMAGAASINVTTKSGTNNIHGALFEFHNDNALNARPYFLPVGQQKPKRIMNQFGGVVGGPIKKDRLFYFVSYEATYERKLASGFATVPTSAVRTGDMSASTRGIYDPLTGDSTGAGRTLFPNNKLPAARLSPIVQKIIPLIPQPLWPNLLSNNYYAAGSSTYTRHRVDSKVNWNPVSRLSMAARISALPLRVFVPAVFGTQLTGAALSTGTYDDVGPGSSNFWNSQVNGVYTVSGHFIVDAAFGYTLEDYKLTMDGFGWDKKIGLDVLGIPGTNGPGPNDGGWPGFAVDSYTRYGGGANAAGRLLAVRDPQYTYSANATWLKGTHNIRFGVDLLRQQMNHWEPLGVQQTFSFAGGPTSVRGGASPDLYNSFATFLLGLPTAIAKSWQTEEKRTRAWSQGLYVRDQWQATRRLTLSYGLRMEYYPVVTRGNRGIEWYDIANNQVQLCGNGSNPIDCGISVKKYFSPRIGVAFRPTDTLVVRTGYSISYDPYSMARPLLSNYPEQINQSVSAPNTYQPTGPLSDGIPAVAAPDLTATSLTVPVTVGITTAPKKYDRGYIQSWNVSIQKQLKPGLTGQVSYVGNSGIRLRSASDVNYGQVGGGLASQALYQKFGRSASTGVIQPLGFSRYHSLQATGERRFSHGFQMNSAFTWSKIIMACCGTGYDPAISIKIPQYYGLNKALASYDRPYSLSLTGMLELPFGKGKRWLNSGGVLGAAASGWQINGMMVRYAGSPFSVSSSGTSLNAPGNSQRADQVKPKVAILGGHGSGQSYFDPLAFMPVSDARFGTAGFGTVRGPGLLNMDISLFRQIAIRERIKVQFRAESYNFINTPNFGNPGANASSMQLNADGTVRSLGGYTEITGMNSTSREGLAERVIQFGLRIAF
jgi:hypothetical protein